MSSELHALERPQSPALRRPLPVPQFFRVHQPSDDLAALVGAEAAAFIAARADMASARTLVTHAATHHELPASARPAETVVKLGRLNDVRWLSKMFLAAGERLEVGGRLVCYFESLDHQRRRRMQRYPRPIAQAVRVMSFLAHRLPPRMRLTRKLYFALTRGRNRALSETEVLGRLVHCGFEVAETREFPNVLCVVATRTGRGRMPVEPSYGPLFAMRRVGKDGKPIFVYKVRTMHPYAEFLQRYVWERNGLDGCRVRNDFRVTRWGRHFRRLWLDELPMLLNLLKGDLKLVGGRPLSEHHESLYPAEVRERRRRHRPGLIPPYYADMPRTFEETVASEVRYLDAYERHPWRTDLRYLWKVARNIVTGRARSS